MGANPDLAKTVSDIVSAYVSNNHVAVPDLPALIASVHAAVSGMGSDRTVADAVEVADDKPTSAQIRKSLQPDGLVSFIDGKPYKTLKRHLTKHGFDPQSYRRRFGLPADYPMVAASYSETRSSLARALGLGRPSDAVSGMEVAGPSTKGRKKAA